MTRDRYCAREMSDGGAEKRWAMTEVMRSFCLSLGGRFMAHCFSMARTVHGESRSVQPGEGCNARLVMSH